MIALDRRRVSAHHRVSSRAGAPAWAADPSLHLVLTPSQKPTDLLATGEEFGQVLGKLVGVPVRVTVASDYAAVIEALRNRTADLAFVHPGGYVLASREAKATIVAQESLARQVLVHLADLRAQGQRHQVAWRSCAGRRSPSSTRPRPRATSIPMVLLIQRGLVKNRDPKTFFKEVVFSGAHDASMRALLNGHVDAIASFDLAREQYLKDPAERERIIFVAETPEIPEAGIAARDGLDPAVFARVRAALLQIRAPEYADLLKRLYEIDGFDAGRGPRLRSGAGRHRAARRPSSLIRPRAPHRS